MKTTLQYSHDINISFGFISVTSKNRDECSMTRFRTLYFDASVLHGRLTEKKCDTN